VVADARTGPALAQLATTSANNRTEVADAADATVAGGLEARAQARVERPRRDLSAKCPGSPNALTGPIVDDGRATVEKGELSTDRRQGGSLHCVARTGLGFIRKSGNSSE
jgi:hypothetical protein